MSWKLAVLAIGFVVLQTFSCAAESSYRDGSVFTVKLVNDWPERRHEVLEGRSDFDANDPSFDLAVIQFEDDGRYLESKQIDAAEDCIRQARESNDNGAVIVVFIHGWHHGAEWARTPSTLASETDGDSHFHAFRLVLESLALREVERYHPNPGGGGRRVVGIYVAWNGDPKDSWISTTPLTFLTFLNRYNAAENIGSSSQFREAMRRIIASTKDPISVPRPESPLVMVGHSMGALMLQSGLLALLEDKEKPLMRQQQPLNLLDPVQVRDDRNVLSFPDLYLSLNSAADSDVAKRTIEILKKHKVRKTAATGHISYSPPLLVSMTSTADLATGLLWPIGKGLSRRTDGHDDSLRTHRFMLTAPHASCVANPNASKDFGQNWHCLRRPASPAAATPVIPIDLPTRERNGPQDTAVPHARYTIMPLGGMTSAHLMWVFQVPPSVIPDHNDIFNSRARSLILGLIQISGAVVSLAEDWTDSFEP